MDGLGKRFVGNILKPILRIVCMGNSKERPLRVTACNLINQHRYEPLSVIVMLLSHVEFRDQEYVYLMTAVDLT